MIRAALVLAVALPMAAPAAAQTRGACADGSLWWSAGSLAGFGPCDAPELGAVLLSCAAGAVALDAAVPVGAAAGAAAAGTLDVDGRTFALAGAATAYPGTGVVGLGGAPLPDAAVDALAAGSRATLALPGETRSLHLTGSGAAIRAMRANCGG